MPATKPTVYLETHSQDPAYNLAFEETVLKVRKDRPYLLLWQNDNTIVVGQNQNTAAEIDPDFVEAHHIHVVRRITGGGAGRGTQGLRYGPASAGQANALPRDAAL